ncbi:hypothetical protein [Mucilaginibacter sp. HD30]
MKKIVLSALALTLAFPSFAQWSTGTGKIYTTTSTDKVGIGTSSPDHPLTVVGLIKSDNLYSNGSTTFLGTAGNTTMTGGANTLVGTGAGSYLTTGGLNTVIGWGGGRMTTGNHNIVLGTVNTSNSNRFPGQGLTSGEHNIFIGNGSGSWLSTGQGNIAVGSGSMTGGNGSYNTILGHNAGINGVSGNNNVYIGQYAGSTGSSTSNNVFIGGEAGAFNSTGNSLTYLGYRAGYSSTDGLTNATAIGYNAQTTASNTVILGNGANVGIGTTAPTVKLTIQGTASASTPAAVWTDASIGQATFGDGEGKSIMNAIASSDASVRPVMFGRRSRGTLAAPTAVQTGDHIASLLSSSYDGTGFQNAGAVTFVAESTPSSGAAPTRIDLITGSNAGNRTARLTVGSTGLVGIGTINPISPLSIASTNSSFGMIRLTQNNTNGEASIGFRDGSDSDAQSWVIGKNVNSSTSDDFRWFYGGTKMMLTTSGDLGIGTTTIPTGYKFAVNGAAIATSVKVQLYTSWPDFVFKKDYQLPTLAEVKTYIDKNQHLPDMPSADEVHNNGLDLGETNRLLTKKVEELTLYLIQQEGRIKALEMKIDKTTAAKKHKNNVL